MTDDTADAVTKTPAIVPHPDVKAEFLAALPRLRAFAMSLCGRGAAADDLVQEALVRGWANLATFEAGTNMLAWLYIILRNQYYSEFRKRRREVPDTDGHFAARLVVRPDQEDHLHFQDFRAALARLGDDHREALILVGASDLSYEEAARICGCAVGTMKSRVHRARTRLAELLAGPETAPHEGGGPIGRDPGRRGPIGHGPGGGGPDDSAPERRDDGAVPDRRLAGTGLPAAARRIA